ncbi:M23 family metallopeptidase [Paraburkholderia nemoris]|uniref:hydroxyethylthiazole kinase n=1 Tax=Paraburkholderia nemoris TaxID=2793076 RepID=UPI0038BB8318
MIISPPFLPARPGHEMDSADAGNTVVPDHDVCAAGMQECAPGNGAFPVSFNLGWHGGSHLVAPRKANGETESVRAIADGTVVYVRQTSPAGKAALQYRGVRTDDGCVVIKHSTEIGEGRSAEITYFSIYMHLQTVRPSIVVGKKIYRKDLLGVPGQIYGQLGQIHFEIVCNDANLEKLFGRAAGPLNAVQGRVDAIYGDIWFRVPKGARIFGNQPHPYRRDASEPPLGPHPSVQTQPPVGITSCDLFIRMHYEKTCTLTTFRLTEDGRSIQVGEPLSSATSFEYDLYAEVNRLNRMYTDGSTAPANPSPKAPSPSLIYEMLRFGRPVSETIPSDVKFAHWRKVVTPEGTGWINFHKPTTIGVYSDADFPHWAGWSLIDDDHTSASHCDSPTIRKWLDLNGDGHVTHTEAKDALRNNDVANRMAQAICKFPIEWTKQDIEKRWGWLETQNEALPAPLSKDDFTVLKAHIEALAFWEDIHDADLPQAAECWHFPPKAFVEHFRKCGWLSAGEIARCFPRKLLHLQGTQFVPATTSWETAFARSRAWTMAFNIGTRRYGISGNRLRLLHLLSHVIPETGNLHYVKEIRGELKSYSPYYGRGLIQLTHLENYKSYGLFRGFHDINPPSEFINLGWNPNELIARDNDGHHNFSNCVDSACFYLVTRNHMLKHMDAGSTQSDAITVSKDVNGYVSIEKLNGLEVRLQSVVYLKSVLLDESSESEPTSITFEWRRNSQQEPVLDAQGNVVMIGHPPHPKKKFYRTQHTIQTYIESQQP